VSQPSLEPTTSPSDTLLQMISILTQLPGGNARFVPLLMAKSRELLPDLVPKLFEANNLPIGAFADPMSPATRFLYEEEVGRGLYTDLRR
jgi:SP family general alpha glucoside:H+ symporter-like MFS transporter